MHIGILAAAANNNPFTIFYNPRASPSEFVIPLAKYNKAMYTQVSLGMQFGMMFETEESGVRRYMGTITGISDLDSVRWKSSQWRNLQDCPICAANLGRDAIGHFAAQHAHSIKWRKKFQKFGFWSNASSNIIKDLRELSSYLGSGNGNETAPNPLVAPFIRTLPLAVPKDNQKDVPSCVAATSDAVRIGFHSLKLEMN